MEYFERAFKMADDCDLAKSCCEGVVASAWFDRYPLMRNVSLIQKELRRLLSEKVDMSPSRDHVVLHMKNGSGTIKISENGINCTNCFATTQLKSDNLVQVKLAVKRFAKHAKNQ